MEEWRDIEGYEGLYQVSNEGRVKSLEKLIIKKNKCGNYSEYRLKEKILKPRIRSKNDNHLELCLYVDSRREHKDIHILVAQAFIPNPHNYTVVHHIDHNPQNNRVENLIWMSDKEHRGIHTSERRSKTVYQYTLEGVLVAVWKNTCEAARQLGGSNKNISACCLGKRNTAYGYKWSYTPL